MPKSSLDLVGVQELSRDWCKVNGLGVRFVLMRGSRSLDPEHRAHNRNCGLDPAVNEGRFGVLVGQ